MAKDHLFKCPKVRKQLTTFNHFCVETPRVQSLPILYWSSNSAAVPQNRLLSVLPTVWTEELHIVSACLRPWNNDLCPDTMRQLFLETTGTFGVSGFSPSALQGHSSSAGMSIIERVSRLYPMLPKRVLLRPGLVMGFLMALYHLNIWRSNYKYTSV